MTSKWKLCHMQLTVSFACCAVFPRPCGVRSPRRCHHRLCGANWGSWRTAVSDAFAATGIVLLLSSARYNRGVYSVVSLLVGSPQNLSCVACTKTESIAKAFDELPLAIYLLPVGVSYASADGMSTCVSLMDNDAVKWRASWPSVSMADRQSGYANTTDMSKCILPIDGDAVN